MTPEERQMLANLFERINATGATPRDAQAEAFINDAVRAVPFAPYVLAQTVLVQQRGLEAASHRSSELEAAARRDAEPQEQGSFLGNLGKSLFGGGGPSGPNRPGYDPSASQRGAAATPGQAYAPPPPQPQANAAAAPVRPLGRAQGPAVAASCTTRCRQRPASPAVSRSGTCSAGYLAAMEAVHLAAEVSLARTFPAAEKQSTTSMRLRRTATTLPNSIRPVRQDASYDDASYTDDSSFDDGGSGGYDDV